MSEMLEPTQRELDILKIIWSRGEATVREVYEEIRDRIPIVQNTVQAVMRTMEFKGLLTYRQKGRTFIYQSTIKREEAGRQMIDCLLNRIFSGAVNELVLNLFTVKQPSLKELVELECLIQRAKANHLKEQNNER